MEEPPYQSINAYRLGNEIQYSNARTAMVCVACVFLRKMALFKKTEDFNFLSYDIGRVKWEVIVTESAQGRQW